MKKTFKHMFTLATVCLGLFGLLFVGEAQAAKATQHLTLEAALKMLLKQNPDIAREHLELVQSKSDIAFAKGAFGLDLKLNLQVDRSNLPAGMQLNPSLWNEESNNLFLQQVQLQGSLSLEKKLALGTTLALQFKQGWGTQDRFNALGESTDRVQTINDGSNSLRLQITQPLLRGAWLPVQMAPIKKAEAQAEAAEQKVAAQILEKIGQTIRIYWDLVYNQRDLKLRQKAYTLAVQQRSNTKLLIQSGRLAAIELAQAEEAVAKRHQELLAAVERMNQVQVQMRDVLHTSKDVSFVPTEEPLSGGSLPSLQRALDRMITENPNVKSIKHRISALKQDVLVAKNGQLPNLDLVAGFQLVGFGRNTGADTESSVQRSLGMLVDPRSHNAYAGLTFSVPLDRRQVNQRVERSQLEVQKQRLMLAQLQRELKNQLQLFHGQGQQILKRIAAAKLTLTWAKRKLSAEKTKFKLGRSTLFQVLLFQQDVSQAELAELRAQVDYHKALISLYEKEGSLLKRFSIRKRS